MEYTQYLIVSALTFDSGSGTCSALEARRCSIYDRRPLACRTVPFHYSQVEASAKNTLEAFVRTPGYECDSGNNASVVLEGARIVDSGMQKARADALALAERDKRWRAEILHRMKVSGGNNAGLPSLHCVEVNAPFGATTTSMRIAWQIAAEAGLISDEECTKLIRTQLATIERQLATRGCTHDARQTLLDMRAEYRQSLNG